MRALQRLRRMSAVLHSTAISFGRLYMTNPDLVERFEQKLPLAELPRTRHFLNTDGLPKRIYPMLGQAFTTHQPRLRSPASAAPRKPSAFGEDDASDGGGGGMED